MIVYSPQIYENYSLQSGEGLSVLFVVIWLTGDLTNLFGALMAGLLPTIIILAVYVSAIHALYSERFPSANSLKSLSTLFATLSCSIKFIITAGGGISGTVWAFVTITTSHLPNPRGCWVMKRQPVHRASGSGSS